MRRGTYYAVLGMALASAPAMTACSSAEGPHAAAPDTAPAPDPAPDAELPDGSADTTPDAGPSDAGSSDAAVDAESPIDGVDAARDSAAPLADPMVHIEP